MSQSCHCEAPQGPWQSRRTVLNFRKISANSKHFTGDSHVASLLGMTKRRLFAIPRIPRCFPLVFPPKPPAGLVFRHPDAKTKCTARQAGRSACQKVPSGLLPSCLQNCKTFCSTVLQFCRCGGLLNAKGNPDGFLSLFSSLRNLRLDWFFDTQTQKRNVPPGKPDGTFRRKERKREKKEKKHEKERGCDLWKTSDQGRGLSCSDGSSALADVVGSSFCTASSLLSNTMGRRNVLP
jgi:hypothetical protein